MVHDENALDAQEVADILHVSRNTVYNLVKASALASYNIGRKMRFTVKDVDAYITTARNSSTEAIASAGSFTTATATTSIRTSRGYTPFRIAGNDMAADVVANYLGGSGIPMQRIYENSYRSLVDMYREGVEGALIHLFDHENDCYNIPYVQRIVPGIPLVVIRMVKRREGLLVKKSNPKGLRTWSDLLRPDVTMANREKGAGSRVLLDEKLVSLKVGAQRPQGYNREFTNTLTLAAFIANGGADVGLGSERAYHQVEGLGFLPLQNEYLDLVMLKTEQTMAAVKFLKMVSSTKGFRAELSNVIGYDVSCTGNIIYEV